MNAPTHGVESSEIPGGEWPQWPDPSIKFEDSRAPVPRGTIEHQSADKCLTSGMWSIEPCTFHATVQWDEFAHILEGEAVVEDLDTGHSVTLKPGKLAHFALGTRFRWTVSKTLKKFYVMKTAKPVLL